MYTDENFQNIWCLPEDLWCIGTSVFNFKLLWTLDQKLRLRFCVTHKKRNFTSPVLSKGWFWVWWVFWAVWFFFFFSFFCLRGFVFFFSLLLLLFFYILFCVPILKEKLHATNQPWHMHTHYYMWILLQCYLIRALHTSVWLTLW